MEGWGIYTHVKSFWLAVARERERVLPPRRPGGKRKENEWEEEGGGGDIIIFIGVDIIIFIGYWCWMDIQYQSINRSIVGVSCSCFWVLFTIHTHTYIQYVKGSCD